MGGMANVHYTKEPSVASQVIFEGLALGSQQQIEYSGEAGVRTALATHLDSKGQDWESHDEDAIEKELNYSCYSLLAGPTVTHN